LFLEDVRFMDLDVMSDLPSSLVSFGFGVDTGAFAFAFAKEEKRAPFPGAGLGLIAPDELLVEVSFLREGRLGVSDEGIGFSPVVEMLLWRARRLAWGFDMVPKTRAASEGSSVRRERYTGSLAVVRR
jgi:hypothetical protein